MDGLKIFVSTYGFSRVMLLSHQRVFCFATSIIIFVECSHVDVALMASLSSTCFCDFASDVFSYGSII